MTYLLCCVVAGGLLGTKLATAERQVEPKALQEAVTTKPSAAVGGGAVVCPLFPLWDYGDDIYMFYAERYESYECVNPLAALYIGAAPGWPWFCPECEAASLLAPSTSRRTGFDGLDRKISADFRPRFPDRLNANDGVSFSGEEFVEMRVSGSDTAHRIKLFRVKIDRPATEVAKRIVRTIYLGYEVEPGPSSAPTFNLAGAAVTPVDGSTHAHRLRVGATEYIVLLAK